MAGRIGFSAVDPQNDETKYYLITHRHFMSRFNKNKIYTVNVSRQLKPEHFVEIVKGQPKKVEFFFFN